MDTIPDREFIEMFERTSQTINLKNCWTPDQIDDRMKKAAKAYLQVKHMVKTDKAKRKWNKKFKATNRLRKETFAERVLFEAYHNPKGRIYMTLAFGYKKAKEIMLERAKKRQMVVPRRITTGLRTRERMRMLRRAHRIEE